MKLRKIVLLTLGLSICFLSCNNDDDGGIEPVEIRDRAEQQATDKTDLLNYLATHYYNSSEFEALTDPTIRELKIKELAEGATTAPDGHTLLKDAAGYEVIDGVKFADIDYEYYIIKLQQGGGVNSPTFSDNVSAVYEGFTLNNSVFDSGINPVSFDLAATITGWQKVFPHFKEADNFVENSDGTINFSNQGIGIMFLPSGLAYFNATRPGIPAYAPLVFKFELLQTTQNDQDNDGIPTYLEDTNGDGLIFDNTDEDFVGAANGSVNPLYDYLDSDDDNDGILTKDEIMVTTENRATVEELKAIVLENNQKLLNHITKEEDGSFTGTIVTFPDTDGDGTADYLDAE